MEMDIVIVFYNDAKWLEQSPCFDWRLSYQALPKGSCVCGVISDKRETLFPPYMSETMRSFWEETLEDARKYLKGGGDETQ